MTDLAISEERDDNLRIERHIWRHIGKQSVREMAAELGVSPEAVLKVKRDMVDSVDDITVQVQRMKLLKQLQELADTAQDKVSEISDERNFSGIVNSSVNAVKTLLVELGKVSKGQDDAVTALNELRVRELVSLMYEVIDGGVPIAAERYGIDQDELFTIFNEVLSRAAARRDLS